MFLDAYNCSYDLSRFMEQPLIKSPRLVNSLFSGPGDIKAAL